MKYNIFLLWVVILSVLISTETYAKENEEHIHEGSSNIKLNYEILDFENSKKKKDGDRYGVEFDYEDKTNHIQLYYENTKTKTTKIVPKDLKVNKYTLKYQYKIDKGERVTLFYATIDDNLMKETDGGDIYGFGYLQNGLSLMEYFSDYPHFNVYQSDFKYIIKNRIKTILIGKYIHLEDKNSNDFSKSAKSDYFTAGLKLHTHYRDFHLGAGVYFGERIFAIMKDGFKIQHHAMEFKESYTLGVGYSLGKNMATHLRYGYHKAKEIQINNDNVKVRNISLDFVYRF